MPDRPPDPVPALVLEPTRIRCEYVAAIPGEPAFYFSRDLVTVGDFARFLDASRDDRTLLPAPSGTPGEPALEVDWDRARSYCEWLDRNRLPGPLVDGMEIRLPTVRECERAAAALIGKPAGRKRDRKPSDPYWAWCSNVLGAPEPAAAVAEADAWRWAHVFAAEPTSAPLDPGWTSPRLGFRVIVARRPGVVPPLQQTDAPLDTIHFVFHSNDQPETNYPGEIAKTLTPIKQPIREWDIAEPAIADRLRANFDEMASKARVIVLLIGREFLASSVICEERAGLQGLLTDLHGKGVSVLPIFLESTLVEQTWISGFLHPNREKKPLSAIKRLNDRFFAAAQEILKAAKRRPSGETSPPP